MIGYQDRNLHIEDEKNDVFNADAEVQEQSLEAQVDLGEDGDEDDDTELGNQADADFDNSLCARCLVQCEQR